MTGPLVSVVVPAWRDRDALAGLLGSGTLRGAEVVVSVPFGEASRYADLVAESPGVRLVESSRGRAAQMNAGAAAAAGRWLLFLHADSRVHPDWQEVVRRADADPHLVGGAFRFTLDSRAWWARVLEIGVRLRVRLLQLPYGDQGIFVRREIFEQMGGYATVPLMEDIELMRRLRTTGQLHFSAMPLVTSARRWEREGWRRRSLTNLSFAARYLLGASPARLAQRYFGRSRCAVVVMARAPTAPGKTRVPAPDERTHAALREALLLDTLDSVCEAPGLDRLVACTPAGALPSLQRNLGPAWDVIAQRGASLGERMAFAIGDVLGLGYESVLVVGSDLPDLPSRLLSQARAALQRDRQSVVIGPAIDGGYYLIGMNQLHPELFDRIDWGADDVLTQTLGAAAGAGLHVTTLESWSDVDTLDDLAQIAHRAGGSGAAPRTRQWFEEHGRGGGVR
jgi:rSAM/selenodomain-associated transferase 2/rSAM/selenodomain-associated transferase 1